MTMYIAQDRGKMRKHSDLLQEKKLEGEFLLLPLPCACGFVSAGEIYALEAYADSAREPGSSAQMFKDVQITKISNLEIPKKGNAK